MRRLIWPVLFLFLVMLQGALTVFCTSWVAFDLPLLALYGYSMLRKEGSGTLAGLGIGLWLSYYDSWLDGLLDWHYP